MNVFIVNSTDLTHKMFLEHGYNVVGDVEDADIMVFTGGADVTPKLYDSLPHPETRNDEARDESDKQYYEIAQELMIPCVGICRGAQFLNVMCGGSLRQHVDNHTLPHKTDFTAISNGGSILVSSTHHQMMSPRMDKCTVLLRNKTICKYQQTVFNNGNICDGKGFSLDYECVHYTEENCLCFQPHPEYEGFEDCTKAFFFFINNYSLNESD